MLTECFWSYVHTATLLASETGCPHPIWLLQMVFGPCQLFKFPSAEKHGAELFNLQEQRYRLSQLSTYNMQTVAFTYLKEQLRC